MATDESVAALADRCRWELKGYRDGEQSSVRDIADRLGEYERCVRGLHGSVQHLTRTVEALNKRLREAEIA